jgi:hypothetical protein
MFVVAKYVQGPRKWTDSLARPKHRKWDMRFGTWNRRGDGIRMDLRDIGWGSVDWIQLAQDMDRWRALVNTVMNLRVLAPQS